jgi:hypothetical protein
LDGGTWIQGANESDQFIGGPITVTLPAAPYPAPPDGCGFDEVTASVSASSADGSKVVLATGHGSARATVGIAGGPVSFLLQSTGATLFEPGAPTERSLTLSVSPTGSTWGGCDGLQARVDAAINVVGLR